MKPIFQHLTSISAIILLSGCSSPVVDVGKAALQLMGVGKTELPEERKPPRPRRAGGNAVQPFALRRSPRSGVGWGWGLRLDNGLVRGFGGGSGGSFGADRPRGRRQRREIAPVDLRERRQRKQAGATGHGVGEVAGN